MKTDTYSGISYAEISRGTGISPSMLSRMFSNKVAQKRPNPTLRTLTMLREFLQVRTGQALTYDEIISAIVE